MLLLVLRVMRVLLAAAAAAAAGRAQLLRRTEVDAVNAALDGLAVLVQVLHIRGLHCSSSSNSRPAATACGLMRMQWHRAGAAERAAGRRPTCCAGHHPASAHLAAARWPDDQLRVFAHALAAAAAAAATGCACSQALLPRCCCQPSAAGGSSAASRQWISSNVQLLELGAIGGWAC